MTRCNCACRCWSSPEPDCDDLCAACWREWCTGSTEHRPAAERSYMAVYGLTGPWTGWLIGRAPHLVAEAASELTRPETPQRCPNQKCRAAMVRRPGAWKCYRREEHEETIAVLVPERFPHSPRLTPLELAG